jgi:16S rRNA processing protein RimM
VEALQLLAVGRVARAHGIRGRVLIAPYNAESQGLERVRQLWVGETRFEVDRAERVNLGYLVALRGVSDRNQADALRGQEVRADRAELPPLDEGEYYAVDLVGFEVVDVQGRPRGMVEELEEAGAQDLLRLTGGTLVPMAFVKEVQGQERRIVVDAPEGLFELEE